MKSLVKKIIFLLLPILPFVLATIFFTNDYQGFIHCLKNIEPEIYGAETIENFISKEGFSFTQILFLFLTSSFLLGSFFLAKKASFIASEVRAFIKNAKEYSAKCLQLFSTLSAFQKIIITSIVAGAIIHKLVMMAKLPLSNDEVFSYIYFIKQDFWISAIYYPEPNNHIFFNLICNFFDLFISDPALCIRLPSLLFFVAAIGLIFFFTYKNFGVLTSIAASALCSFSIGPAFYSIQGRGYMAMSFFALLASFSIFEYLKNPDRKFLIHLFVLSSILGMYTIPIFLYPFIGTLLYASYAGNKETYKPVLIASLVIGISVLILYSPLILLNGWEALAGNKWVKAKDIKDLARILPAASAESIDYVLGTYRRGYAVLLIFALACLFLWKKSIFSKSEKSWLTFTLANLAAIFLLIILLRNFPPYRVWTYLTFFIHIFLSLILTRSLLLLLKNKSVYLIALFLMGYTCLMILLLQPDPKSIAFHKELNRHVKEILKSNPSSIYIDKHELMESALRFFSLKENKTLDLDIAHPKIEKNYDYMIFYNNTRPSISLKDYSKVLFFDQAVIYKKKDPKD